MLILSGGAIYLRGGLWSGFAVLVTGFIELEYWASPTFFGGAGDTEFRLLLINKLVLSILAFLLLCAFWRLKDRRKPQSDATDNPDDAQRVELQR
jgi:hypothetical protein